MQTPTLLLSTCLHLLFMQGSQEASSMLSVTGQGHSSRVALSTLTGQGQQSLTLQGTRSYQGPGWVCVCSEILGGGPLKRRFCAFLCHFPGADGVLKLWMQCPSFQASAVSVERMPRLKVRECGVKPIKNEASRSGRGGSQVWDPLSVLIPPTWL